MAINAIENTFNYHETGKINKNCQIILSRNYITKYLESLGFENIISNGEGKIVLDKNKKALSFYKSEYANIESVYEILAWGKKDV